MIVLLSITVAVLWILGAALTAKANAMNCHCPTSFGDFCIALVVWPGVAVMVCITKHDCGRYTVQGDDPDYHY